MVWFLNFEGMFWYAGGFGYVIVLITLGLEMLKALGEEMLTMADKGGRGV